MIPDVYTATPPTTYLEQYVKSYWRYQKDFKAGVVETIFPDSSYELIWVNQGTLYVNGKKMPRFYVGGQSDEPLALSAQGVVELWAVRFLPWGLTPFADVSQAARGMQIDASKVMGLEAFALRQILEGADAESFSAVFEDYFLEKLLRSRFNDAFLEQATQFLLQNKNRTTVKELAAYCNKSLRQIERNMLASTGRTPIKNISLLRFEQVRNALMINPDTPISHIVEQQGYSDQSHLIKEFKQYAHMTPNAFAHVFKDAAKSFSWQEFQEKNVTGESLS